MPTRRIRSEHAALGYSDHVVGGDRATLVYLVNLGCISHHPWSCTIDALDRPDMLLFDLDPTEIAFREVRNAAMLVRDLLAQFRLRSWVKTSGGAGLHVMVPLAREHPAARENPDRRASQPSRRHADQPVFRARACARDRVGAPRMGGARASRVSGRLPREEHPGAATHEGRSVPRILRGAAEVGAAA
jgi:DNA primase